MGTQKAQKAPSPGRAVRPPPFPTLPLLAEGPTVVGVPCPVSFSRRGALPPPLPLLSPLGILGVGPGLCFSLGRHPLHTNRPRRNLHPSTAQGLWSSGGGQLQGLLAC